MMNLTDLVPPLELCKLIPDGEFQDSALLWRKFQEPWQKKAEWQIIQRVALPNKENVFPAPTLQEIMAKMQYCRIYKKTQNFYVAVKNKERTVSINGATAALKLWLKLKGIEA